MIASAERALRLLVPFVAILAVALGLRLGAGGPVRAALVEAAPAAGAGTGLAWQVVALEEENGARTPLPRLDLDVTAEGRGATTHWHGTTNDDGIAEADLALSASGGLSLDVRAAGDREPLARGVVVAPPPVDRVRPETPWMPFARREGSIDLDVAVLGQRAAPGFPAEIWVRATDAATHERLADVSVEPEADPSVASATAIARTNEDGWAKLEVTPVGLAVSLRLGASAKGGSGRWIGGLFMSPGGAHIGTRARFRPDETPVVDLTLPAPRRGAYFEIDDARGRAWAAVVDASSETADRTGMVHLRPPKLLPGLYWATVASAPAGAAALGPGTTVRPFFVAATDADALRFGTDPAECAAGRDAPAAGRRLGSCLAVTAATPVPRWTALDGFTGQRARSREKRARGLALALGAVVAAILLETLLLLRTAATSRARLRAAANDGEDAPPVSGRFGVAIALLVAVLGLILLAVFLVRAA